MRILKVIHGYPMRYNAGSEVCTQTICQALARTHEVHVFTREEDPLRPDFEVREEFDSFDSRVCLHVVNNPRNRDRYRVTAIDERFGSLLDEFKPAIVHIGHLNHLSTSIVNQAAYRTIPVVMTLHDYWLMCPRGQFMQMFPEYKGETWVAYDGQENRRCAERCYAGISVALQRRLRQISRIGLIGLIGGCNTFARLYQKSIHLSLLRVTWPTGLRRISVSHHQRSDTLTMDSI